MECDKCGRQIKGTPKLALPKWRYKLMKQVMCFACRNPNIKKADETAMLQQANRKYSIIELS